MSRPLVSIIVATYRRDVALKNALISLAEQTYDNIEILLVSDNADDEYNTKVIMIFDALKRDYPHIIIKFIVNEKNEGSAETRNIGIRAANGEYVTFLDDDDLYLPEKISKQLEFMENGKYDYSVTDLELFNENDKMVERRTRNYIQDNSPISLLKYHLKYHITGTDTMMFTKKYLLKIGGFAPIDIGDEFYLMQRAIEGRGMFGYCPGCEIKAYIHTSDNGLSSGDGKIEGENALYEYKKTCFGMVDTKTRRYIKMRHYAVLAFVEIRRKRFAPFFVNAAKSLWCAPFQCINLFRDRCFL